MKLSETIKKVISLSEAIRSYWDAELPKRHLHYPLVSPGEDSGPPPPEEDELKQLLAGLPPDDIFELALIMHLGRGDFGTDALASHYEALKQRFGRPERAASRMMRQTFLAEYLKDGLVELQRAGIDVDHLDFAPVSAAT